jgi:putative DNA primase/helicase
MTPQDKVANLISRAEVRKPASNDAWELPPLEAYEDTGVPTDAVTPPAKAPQKIPPLALLWFATLIDAKPPAQLVKNLLLTASLFVVFGESNSGKTFWVIDLGLGVAAGRWRGRRAQKGLVIYVAGEGAASVRARVAAYRQVNPDIQDLPFAIVPFAVDFLDSDSIAYLIETIRTAESECGQKAALLIIDTFARAIPGGNENDAKDVGLAVAGADRIRTEIGCCVGFVHHCGKDPSKGARGSSALRAATDTEILIEGQEGQRTATVTKQRDLEGGGAMPFDLVPVTIGIDPDSNEEITSCTIKHVQADERPVVRTVEMRGKAQRQFIAAMRARSKDDPQRVWPLIELREIGRELGMSKGTARSVVDVLTGTPYMQTCAFGYRFTDGRVEG